MIQLIRICHYQRDDLLWVAQGIDHDVVFIAPSLHELKTQVLSFFVAEVNQAENEQRTPFDGIPVAPESYREMYEVLM